MISLKGRTQCRVQTFKKVSQIKGYLCEGQGMVPAFSRPFLKLVAEVIGKWDGVVQVGVRCDGVYRGSGRVNVDRGKGGLGFCKSGEG